LVEKKLNSLCRAAGHLGFPADCFFSSVFCCQEQSFREKKEEKKKAEGKRAKKKTKDTFLLSGFAVIQ